MTIYMETTKISATKTGSEIQNILAKYGAKKVMIDYSNGEPESIVFSIMHNGQQLCYKLPCRKDKIYKYLQDKRTYPGGYVKKDWEQSIRIAWRQILRWIQAQFALLEIGMVDIKEVFLPYCFDGKQTLYESLEKDNFKQLTCEREKP